MKNCYKCNITKPLEDFQKDVRRGDGHTYKCKECARDNAYEHKMGKKRALVDKLTIKNRTVSIRTIPVKKCITCGERLVFKFGGSHKKYCGRRCYNHNPITLAKKIYNEKTNSLHRTTRDCLHCGKPTKK